MTGVLQAAIPVLMSGEVMAGAPPMQAAALQAAALFCTAACAGLAAAGAVLAATLTVVDGAHRLRLDRLRARSASGAGVGAWLQAQLLRARARLLIALILRRAVCFRPITAVIVVRFDFIPHTLISVLQGLETAQRGRVRLQPGARDLSPVLCL